MLKNSFGTRSEGGPVASCQHGVTGMVEVENERVSDLLVCL